MAIKIAVCNNKGGVGKTTTAICLAQELKRRGNRVLFVDTDPQCNSTNFYEAEFEGRATMVDLLCGDSKASDTIQTTEKGDVIPSDPELKNADTSVKVNEKMFFHIRNRLPEVANNYDYIIFDTQPAINITLRNVLAASDYVIIPMEESGFAVNGLMNIAEAVDMAKNFNPNLQILGILTVKTKDRTKKAARMGDLMDEIAKNIGTTRFNVKIRECVACAEALTEYYVPLYEYAPNSTTNADYEAFTTEVLEKIGGKQ